MLKSRSPIKPIACLVVVFITLGVTIANETLGQLGLEQNYVLLFSFAFVVAILLLSRSWFYIGVVLLGVAAINLPDATLLRYGLDRDVVIAFVCAVILLPTVYRLVAR